MSSIKEIVLKLRKEGKSYGEIHRISGVSKSYISSICMKENLNDIGLTNYNILSSEEIERMKEFYNTHTIKETAKEFGVSRTTVIKYKKNKRILHTKEEKIVANYLGVKSYRNRMKEKAVEYKGRCCQICGYDRCIRALDFHHIDSSKKDFTISSNCNKSWERIKIEIDKCILVCSNCHRELHSGLVDLNSVGIHPV